MKNERASETNVDAALCTPIHPIVTRRDRLSASPAAIKLRSKGGTIGARNSVALIGHWPLGDVRLQRAAGDRHHHAAQATAGVSDNDRTWIKRVLSSVSLVPLLRSSVGSRVTSALIDRQTAALWRSAISSASWLSLAFQDTRSSLEALRCLRLRTGAIDVPVLRGGEFDGVCTVLHRSN